MNNKAILEIYLAFLKSYSQFSKKNHWVRFDLHKYFMSIQNSVQHNECCMRKQFHWFTSCPSGGSAGGSARVLEGRQPRGGVPRMKIITFSLKILTVFFFRYLSFFMKFS